MMSDNWIALLKTVSWRVVATIDTFILATFITKQAGAASLMAGLEVVSKMLVYYVHERVWLNYIGERQSVRISGLKAITWRVIASTMTFGLGLIIFGDGLQALTISAVEFATKMGLYFVHERAWDYGLSNYFLVKINATNENTSE